MLRISMVSSPGCRPEVFARGKRYLHAFTWLPTMRPGIGFLLCPCQAPLLLVHDFTERGRENVTMLSGRPVARHIGADGVGESVGPDKGPPCSCEGSCTLVEGGLGLWAWGWELLPPCWDRVARPKNTVLAPHCSPTLDTQCVRGSVGGDLFQLRPALCRSAARGAGVDERPERQGSQLLYP